MTLAIAWGTPYFAGGPPGRAPFTPGAQGSIANADLIGQSFTFGLTEAPGYATVSVAHMYAPTSGAPEYLVDTYYLYLGNTFVVVYAGDLERDGLHTFTASIGYDELQTKLVLAVTPDDKPANDDYGAVAWYEEAAAPLVFWTRFINSKEVIG